MKTLDIVLARFLQFLVMLFFTFAVFLWYGVAALAPLAIWISLISFFTPVFGGIFSMLLGLAIVSAVGYHLYKIPKLLNTFIETGVDLCKLGYVSVKRMGEIGAAVENDAPPQEKEIKIVLEDKLS